MGWIFLLLWPFLFPSHMLTKVSQCRTAATCGMKTPPANLASKPRQPDFRGFDQVKKWVPSILIPLLYVCSCSGERTKTHSEREGHCQGSFLPCHFLVTLLAQELWYLCLETDRGRPSSEQSEVKRIPAQCLASRSEVSTIIPKI